jgi:hypothetical protein
MPTLDVKSVETFMTLKRKSQSQIWKRLKGISLKKKVFAIPAFAKNANKRLKTYE